MQRKCLAGESAIVIVGGCRFEVGKLGLDQSGHTRKGIVRRFGVGRRPNIEGQLGGRYGSVVGGRCDLRVFGNAQRQCGRTVRQ